MIEQGAALTKEGSPEFIIRKGTAAEALALFPPGCLHSLAARVEVTVWVNEGHEAEEQEEEERERECTGWTTPPPPPPETGGGGGVGGGGGGSGGDAGMRAESPMGFGGSDAYSELGSDAPGGGGEVQAKAPPLPPPAESLPKAPPVDGGCGCGGCWQKAPPPSSEGLTKAVPRAPLVPMKNTVELCIYFGQVTAGLGGGHARMRVWVGGWTRIRFVRVLSEARLSCLYARVWCGGQGGGGRSVPPPAPSSSRQAALHRARETSILPEAS